MAPITAAMDTTSKKDELVAILDAGAQYGKVIFGFLNWICFMFYIFELNFWLLIQDGKSGRQEIFKSFKLIKQKSCQILNTKNLFESCYFYLIFLIFSNFRWLTEESENCLSNQMFCLWKLQLITSRNRATKLLLFLEVRI